MGWISRDFKQSLPAKPAKGKKKCAEMYKTFLHVKKQEDVVKLGAM